MNCIGLQETYFKDYFLIESTWKRNTIFTPFMVKAVLLLFLVNYNWGPISIEQLEDNRGHIVTIKNQDE